MCLHVSAYACATRSSGPAPLPREVSRLGHIGWFLLHHTGDGQNTASNPEDLSHILIFRSGQSVFLVFGAVFGVFLSIWGMFCGYFGSILGGS